MSLLQSENRRQIITPNDRCFQSLWLLLWLLIGAPSIGIASETWQRQKSSADVTVFSMPLANGYVAVKAQTKVQAPPHALTNLLADVEVAPQWIASCLEVRVISGDSGSDTVVHTFFDATWPVKNRDMITHSYTRVDPASNITTITIEDRNHSLTELNNFVRMRNVSGQWTLTPLGTGQTLIEYEGVGEPGGNLPVWLANRIIVSNTHQTFANMRQWVIKPRYENYSNP